MSRHVVRHGEATDPVGDAVPVPGAAHPPDLVHGAVDIVKGEVTFGIRFANGSLDDQTTRVTIELDVDRNPATGIRTPQGLGIDFIVDLWARNGEATIERAVPTGACTTASPCYATVGRAYFRTVDDEMRATIPAALVGITDGPVTFRVMAYVSPQDTDRPTIVSDVMPDQHLPPGVVQ